MHNKAILIIMDGWGIAEDPNVSAIAQGETPFYDYCLQHYPNIQLEASGSPVGLPDGQMGNSEVGHMNIGAGRIVYQMLVRIGKSMQEGDFEQNDTWKNTIAYCRENNKPLHLMGLLSDGGVHSHIDHVKGIIRLLANDPLPAGVFVHVFSDGRDTAPQGGAAYVEDLEACMQEAGVGKIASITGRYFAMDRDKRWERTRKAYDAIVHGKGAKFSSAADALRDSYAQDITDEFVEPVVITENDQPVATLNDGDAVLFFNYRTDRGRQLTTALTQQDFPEEEMKTLDLHFTTLTRYNEAYKGINVIFESGSIANGLGEWLSKHGKTQIRIAETEKYPHVTFFFNGGREKPMEGEEHLLCASPKVATYDLQPTMSAFDIRDAIIPRLQAEDADFVCLNFANPDMVGHTGDMDAAIKACETVDACTKAVAEAAAEHGYKVLITADHGNADRMRNPDGSPHTAHTTVPVALSLIDPKGTFTFTGQNGKLGDLAPTILTLMGLPIPAEMTGEVLVNS
ncbi:MAG: 2,3-bisphosphoglycerate-independent phosphoglycerate mutase [Bacteroidia bacterium]